MSISGIISVAGKPGLYKIVTQTKNGLIAESLIDEKRIPVYATQKVSALEEISIYTDEEDMPLSEVMGKMYEKTEGKEAIDPKSDPARLRDFFGEVVENFDRERVYNSDLKKLFQWFNILVSKGLLEPEKEEEKEKEEKSGKTAKKTAKTPAKGAKPAATAKKTPKPAPKKAAPKGSAAKATVKSAPRKVGGGK